MIITSNSNYTLYEIGMYIWWALSPLRKIIKMESTHSELIEISLLGNSPILHAVIGLLSPDIEHKPDRYEVEIPDGNPDLTATQKEQRRGHFPLTSASPFFACTSVIRLSPHSSRICGSTW